MRLTRLNLGKFGEDIASQFLVSHGYQILSRNWRSDRVELDIIARDAHTIVFCEVKTRQSATYGLPAEAITRVKRSNLRRAALLWLSSNSESRAPIRFDVIAITLDDQSAPHITHIKGIDV